MCWLIKGIFLACGLLLMNYSSNEHVKCVSSEQVMSSELRRTEPGDKWEVNFSNNRRHDSTQPLRKDWCIIFSARIIFILFRWVLLCYYWGVFSMDVNISAAGWKRVESKIWTSQWSSGWRKPELRGRAEVQMNLRRLFASSDVVHSAGVHVEICFPTLAVKRSCVAGAEKADPAWEKYGLWGAFSMDFPSPDVLLCLPSKYCKCFTGGAPLLFFNFIYSLSSTQTQHCEHAESDLAALRMTGGSDRVSLRWTPEVWGMMCCADWGQWTCSTLTHLPPMHPVAAVHGTSCPTCIAVQFTAHRCCYFLLVGVFSQCKKSSCDRGRIHTWSFSSDTTTKKGRK